MKLARDQPIRCRCGQVQAVLGTGAPITRAVCYCLDCQAYARALPNADCILDAQDGSDVVATLQRYVRFTDGIERLACLSLTERGLLRWYARCCGTPIGNTPRDPKLSYVGLLHSCLASEPRSLDAVFGPPSFATNVEHARGTVRTSAVRSLIETVRIIGRLLWARVNGSWRHSPFFDRDLRPIVSPHLPQSVR